MRPRHDREGTHFEISSKGCNNLSHLTVWERGAITPLWDINLRYFTGSEIKYGELPTKPANQYFIPQRYPLDGSPAPIPVGKDILVKIDYQYDEMLAPSTGHRIFGFKLEADGSISDVDSQGAYRSMPNIPEPNKSSHSNPH